MTNLDRYKKDLDALVKTGEQLDMSIQAECYPEEFKAQVKKALGDKATDLLKALPGFAGAYQRWYSEAKALIRQLLKRAIGNKQWTIHHIYDGKHPAFREAVLARG